VNSRTSGSALIKNADIKERFLNRIGTIVARKISTIGVLTGIKHLGIEGKPEFADTSTLTNGGHSGCSRVPDTLSSFRPTGWNSSNAINVQSTKGMSIQRGTLIAQSNCNNSFIHSILVIRSSTVVRTQKSIEVTRLDPCSCEVGIIESNKAISLVRGGSSSSGCMINRRSITKHSGGSSRKGQTIGPNKSFFSETSFAFTESSFAAGGSSFSETSFKNHSQVKSQTCVMRPRVLGFRVWRILTFYLTSKKKRIFYVSATKPVVK